MALKTAIKETPTSAKTASHGDTISALAIEGASIENFVIISKN
jgi:hypothetical protein